MAKSLKRGDKVEWTSSRGKSVGKVEKKVAKVTKVKKHVAKATKSEPEYLVRSDKSGKKAVHHARSLKKV